MDATVEYCFLNLSSEEVDVLYDAMKVYKPAMEADFSATPAFLRLVSDAQNAINLYILSNDVHIAAMELSVWYSAVNYFLDTENLPPQKAEIAKALVCGLAPYCDCETDPAAYYARKDHDAKMQAIEHDAKMQVMYEKFLMGEGSKS